MPTCCEQVNTKLKTGEIINEIKELIEGFNTKNASKNKEDHPKRSPEVRGQQACCRGRTDLAKECREFRKRKECEPPSITAIALHEFRPSSDYSKMKRHSTSQVTYTDATASCWSPMHSAPWELPRKPSQELLASTLYQNCECARRNGLQQDCPRRGCLGRPQCLAVNPGPCCWPSQSRKPVRGDRRHLPPGHKPC